MNSSLDWFGLGSDADERALKRAYAQKLKTTRPDVDPAGFQELHTHYQAALAWLQHQASIAPREASALLAESSESEAPPATSQLVLAPFSADRPIEPQRTPPRPLPSTTQFDMDVFTADYFDQAIHRDPVHLQAWLDGREELWSLHLKQQVGRTLLQRLFRDPPPIGTDSLDVTLSFFGMDHALTGIDPLHMQQLRDAMQERNTLVRRVKPVIHPWGANRRRLDSATFLAWFVQQVEMGENELQAATLYVQPALLSLAAREHAAAQVLDHLLQHKPPLPQDCTGLLFQRFNLGQLTQQRQLQAGELVAHLHMRWLMEPRQANQLALQVKEPNQKRGEPAEAQRYLAILRRPLSWWLLLLGTLETGLFHSLGLFAWRLSGGVPERLDDFFPPRMTRFCIAVANRSHMSWPRVIVGAVRCGIALTLCATIQAITVYTDALSPESRWLPMIIGSVILVCWLYWMGFTALRLWQQRPEQPVQPWPLQRLSLIPAMAVSGVVLAYAFEQIVAAQCILLTATMLAHQRYLARNPQSKGAQRRPAVGAVYLFGLLTLFTFQIPLVSAGFALFYWTLDLTLQRKQMRFRHKPPIPAGDVA